MKNSVKLLSFLMFALVSISAQAQIFGVKGGVGLANITSPNQDTNDLFGRTLGAKVAGTIEFDITDELYIGSGLGFAKKGASSNSGNFNLLYIELPVGARYDIFEIGGSGYFYAAAGLNLGFMVSARFDGDKLNIGNTNDDNFKTLDLGLNTGIGVIFNDSFQVGLGTEFGLLDISTTDTSNLKNIMLMVTLGYKFGQ